MHEVSIAIAMLNVAMKHVPAHTKLKSVKLLCGPMRGIDEASMRWAWQSVTTERGMRDVILHMEMLPWEMHCTKCDKQWVTHEFDAHCDCGFDLPEILGGDDLKVVGIEVDKTHPAASSN